MRQSAAATREIGQHPEWQHKKQGTQAGCRCCHQAPALPGPQHQRSIGQRLQQAKNQQVACLPVRARAVANLVVEGQPLVLCVPYKHRRHHGQGCQHRRPQPRLAQQLQAVSAQQAGRHRQRGQNGRVFGQAGQAQQQPQQQPILRAVAGLRAHQAQGLSQQGQAEQHQQAVWHQGNAQQVEHRRQNKHQHCGQASLRLRWAAGRAGAATQVAGELVDQPARGQPDQAGHQS